MTHPWTIFNEYFKDELEVMTMKQLREESTDEALNRAWRSMCKLELEAREVMQNEKEKRNA